jgi:hypothetical protein
MLLVAPDSSVHTIHTRADLQALVDRFHIGPQLHGNLRQLCGFDPVGKDRKQRKTASGWYLLSDFKWLQRHGSSTAIPVIGKPEEIYAAVQGLANDLSLKKVRTMLQPSGPNEFFPWQKVAMPCAAGELTDGATLCSMPVSAQVCAIVCVLIGVPFHASSSNIILTLAHRSLCSSPCFGYGWAACPSTPRPSPSRNTQRRWPSRRLRIRPVALRWDA